MPTHVKMCRHFLSFQSILFGNEFHYVAEVQGGYDQTYSQHYPLGIVFTNGTFEEFARRKSRAGIIQSMEYDTGDKTACSQKYHDKQESHSYRKDDLRNAFLHTAFSRCIFRRIIGLCTSV